MTLWPDSVVIGGSAIPLASVAADLTLHHGRVGVFDQPSASTCQLTVYDVDASFAHSFRVGVSLVVTVRDGAGAAVPRFTGRVTDARLDTDDLTVMAAGVLSTLYRYPVGAVAWPVEPWSARIARIFTEAGLSSLLDLRMGAFDPPLAARDPATAGPTTLGDYLTFLVPMIGAAVVDTTDGKVMVQTLSARTLDTMVEISPADVGYAPAWAQDLPTGNVVTVRYTGDQSESVTVRDDASVALYGERPITVDTSFTALADATARANERLQRGAYTHWNMPAAPVLRGLVLPVGAPLKISQLPAAAPYDPWTPVLEGWTDTITGDDWVMELALSDPLASGLVLPWDAVPPDLLWTQVDPATDWTEALTLEDLIAG